VFGWADKTKTMSTVAGGSLTWAFEQYQWSGGSGEFQAIAVAYAQAPSGLATSTTITGTLSATQSSKAAASMSFTGVATSSPLDGTAVKTQSAGAGATTWTSGSIALSAGSVLVTGVWDEAGTSHTATAGTEAVESRDTGDGYGVELIYRIESGAGSVNNAGSFGANTKWVQISLPFLSAGGGGGATVKQLAALGVG
jgi:hypothetical protein